MKKFEIIKLIPKENYEQIGLCLIISNHNGLIEYEGWGGQHYYTTWTRLNNYRRRQLIKVIE